MKNKTSPRKQRDHMPPPMAVRRWHVVSPPIRPSRIQKSRRIYVRPRTGSQSAHLYGGRRWLSCRQPACLQPRQAAAPWDRQKGGQTDRQTEGWIAVSFNAPSPLGWGHNKYETRRAERHQTVPIRFSLRTRAVSAARLLLSCARPLPVPALRTWPLLTTCFQNPRCSLAV